MNHNSTMTHKGTVTLETERLILRRFTIDDAEAMFRNWANDIDVVRYMLYDLCDTIEATRKHIDQWLRYFDEPGARELFAIVLKTTGELIGTIDYAEIDIEVRSAEVGYQLGKSWWGSGYATEALRAVIAYCFEDVKLNRIWADFDIRNTASGRVMQKAGMLYEGTFRQCKVSRGELASKSQYAIIAEDYFGQRSENIPVIPNEMIKRITPLKREQWQGHVLPFHYVSHNYYDVEIIRSGDNFNVSFIKKPFDTPFEYIPEKDYDKLFQPHWEQVKAWGIARDGRLIAAIETAVEEWSNRLRVTELWIDDAYRRQGIGKALMDIAVNRAREEKRRVIMLETQSRNENAIAFYLSYGFTLIGFNACEYQNNDLARKEVRLEMGMLLT